MKKLLSFLLTAFVALAGVSAGVMISSRYIDDGLYAGAGRYSQGEAESSAPEASEQDGRYDSPDKPFSLARYNMLSEKGKTAYMNIFNAVREHPDRIKVPALSAEEMTQVFEAVRNDNPDILCFTDACRTVTSGSVAYFEFEYACDVNDCNAKMKELDSVAQSVAERALAIEDEFERELFIHDYIVENCKYIEDAEYRYNAYGCLVDGSAVCSGYARGAMLLLGKAGIESVLVSGVAVSSDGSSEGHMWNVVTIDSAQYVLDVTWGDPVSNEGGYPIHTYFNLTSADVAQSHTQASPVIECTATQSNYFVRGGTLFSSYDSETLGEISQRLVENTESGTAMVEFRFTDEATYSQAFDALFDSGSDAFEVVSAVPDEYSDEYDLSRYVYSYDEDLHCIRIILQKAG